jgi:hypothetical protein
MLWWFNMGEIHCKVKLKGSKRSDEFDGYFDSGATYSHVDKDIADRIGVVMLDYNVNIKIGDGTTKEEPLAVAFATIDGCEHPIYVTIVEKGAVPVTIGADAMQRMGIVLDPQHESYFVRCNIPKE